MENLAHPTDFFSRVAVMAYAPARGTGMKVKVLESMAYGVPVVTTAEGAEGLACEDGVHCSIREDDEGLAEAIVVAAERRQEPSRRCAKAARSLVQTRYSREPFLAQMIALYDQVRQRVTGRRASWWFPRSRRRRVRETPGATCSS